MPRNITESAYAVIGILAASGQSNKDIAALVQHPNPQADYEYEQYQIDKYGYVAIAAEALRAEILRLVTATVH